MNNITLSYYLNVLSLNNLVQVSFLILLLYVKLTSIRL